MIEHPETATVGEIVATDSRSAAVFERFGIDFCCGGGRSLQDACRTARVDAAAVVEALGALKTQAAPSNDESTWALDDLVRHIVDTHHAYVRTAMPAIATHLAKLSRVHGPRHPELHDAVQVWDSLARDFDMHMMKEEQMLFPYIVDLADSRARGGSAPGSPFGTVENPIRMMMREHQSAADDMHEIKALTNGYTPPADGCTTYRVCMEELRQFDEDLHRHVHLENNILFPRAVDLEQQTTA